MTPRSEGDEPLPSVKRTRSAPRSLSNLVRSSDASQAVNAGASYSQPPQPLSTSSDRGRQRAISAEYISIVPQPQVYLPAGVLMGPSVAYGFPPNVAAIPQPMPMPMPVPIPAPTIQYNEDFPPLGAEPSERRGAAPVGASMRRSNSLEDVSDVNASHQQQRPHRARSSSFSREQQGAMYLRQPPALPQNALTTATSYTFALPGASIPSTIAEQREPRRLQRRHTRERSLSPRRQQQVHILLSPIH